MEFDEPQTLNTGAKGSGKFRFDEHRNKLNCNWRGVGWHRERDREGERERKSRCVGGWGEAGQEEKKRRGGGGGGRNGGKGDKKEMGGGVGGGGGRVKWEGKRESHFTAFLHLHC